VNIGNLRVNEDALKRRVQTHMLHSMGKDNQQSLTRNASQASGTRLDNTPSHLHGDSRIAAPHQVGSLNYVLRKNE
jgi:hypothetical protein